MEKIFQSKKPFIAYLTAGDGGKEFSLQCFLALIEGRVDILEIGIPFSDPIADGPVIQKAMQRALNLVTLQDVLEIVKRIREKSSVPIILFSYYNPVLQAGSTFLKKAKDAGVNALLIVDLPFEESLHIHELPLIYLLSPSTSLKRAKMISQKASGFLYYVMRRGTTGMKEEVPLDLEEKIKELKKVVSLPICTGFGIQNKKMAEDTLKASDGFIVGSFFVKAIEEGASPKDLCRLAKTIDPRKV